MKHALRRFYGFFLDVLFPLECVGCKTGLDNNDQGPVCPACLVNIPIIKRINQLSPTFFLAAVSFYDDKLLKELIHLFKYESVLPISKTLEILIRRFLNANNLEYFINKPSTVIIPIPLHYKKFRERGFNQAEIIAKILSKELNLPLGSHILKKIKNTNPQIKMKTNSERAKNILGSFELDAGGIKALQGKDIILVDDVFTSGATTKEAAKVLRKAGAKKIMNFVVART